MKTLLGLLCIIGGAVLGMWLGVFVLFIGGIVQIINSFPHQTLGGYSLLNATGIAFGILKILISGFVGWVSFILSVVIGKVLLED